MSHYISVVNCDSEYEAIKNWLEGDIVGIYQNQQKSDISEKHMRFTIDILNSFSVNSQLYADKINNISFTYANTQNSEFISSTIEEYKLFVNSPPPQDLLAKLNRACENNTLLDIRDNYIDCMIKFLINYNKHIGILFKCDTN